MNKEGVKEPYLCLEVRGHSTWGIFKGRKQILFTF